MMFMRVATVVLAVAVWIGSSSDASAQLFNQPFGFKFRGGSGVEVGLSTAHKQIMLERELAGRSSDNPIVRDFSGALLEVQESNNQAFISTQSAPFIPGTSSRGLNLGGLGYGVSGGGSSVGVGGFSVSSTGAVMARWIWALGGDRDRGPSTGPSYSMAAASIDVWVSQLNEL